MAKQKEAETKTSWWLWQADLAAHWISGQSSWKQTLAFQHVLVSLMLEELDIEQMLLEQKKKITLSTARMVVILVTIGNFLDMPAVDMPGLGFD